MASASSNKRKANADVIRVVLPAPLKRSAAPSHHNHPKPKRPKTEAPQPSISVGGSRHPASHPTGLAAFVCSFRERGPYGEFVVYSDGACPSNGHGASIAGCGVYDATDGQSLSSIPPEPFTNQRAELYALQMAVEYLRTKYLATPGARAIVKSDSMYAIQCIRDWVGNWKRKSWLTTKGEPVKNRDIIERIDALFPRDGTITLEWVEGHAGHKGNEAADAIACAAAAAADPRKRVRLV